MGTEQVPGSPGLAAAVTALAEAEFGGLCDPSGGFIPSWLRLLVQSRHWGKEWGWGCWGWTGRCWGWTGGVLGVDWGIPGRAGNAVDWEGAGEKLGCAGMDWGVLGSTFTRVVWDVDAGLGMLLGIVAAPSCLDLLPSCRELLLPWAQRAAPKPLETRSAL